MRGALAIILLGIANLSFTSSVFAQTWTGDSIANPLSDHQADATRGRAIIASRQTGLCLLCHSGPFSEERFQGNLAPDLGVSVQHLSPAQLRARMVDPSRFNPNTIMPSYYRTEGLNRVSPKFQGETLLSAQEIEDVIAFLVSLKKDSTQ